MDCSCGNVLYATGKSWSAAFIIAVEWPGAGDREQNTF
jgi:hypothetical protein